MADVMRPALSACPACAALPAAQSVAQVTAPVQDARIVLSLPAIHCAACISGVERLLAEVPGVRAARVNLTLKRAQIEAAPEVTAPDLIAVLQRAGFEAHELDQTALRATDTDRAGRDLLMRLAVAGFAAMNIMLLSVAVWSGADGPTRDLFHWISAAIALPAIAFSAQPFFRNAWGALRVGRLNMDVPIALAIALAVVTSLWETSLSGAHAYFDAAITLTFFLLAGRYLDHRTRAVARSAAEELAALEVPRVWRLTDTGEAQIPIAELSVGDLIRVRAGGRLPVDGEVVAGQSELDRSLLTGETRPVYAGVGTAVSAGEINLTGPLTVRAVAVGRDTSLQRMADLVAVAESGRSRYTSLADKAAKLYAPGVHILSALAFVGWYVYSLDLRMAVNIAAAVLIITCPCALGLAVPAVTTAASGRLFRKGVLIKDATALERLAQVDTLVFDKTGTLTTGTPKVVSLDGYSRRDLSIAAALAQGSSHPLAKALARSIAAAGLNAASLRQISERPGHGTEGIWHGQTVRLGRAAWVGGADTTSEICTETCTWLRIGQHAPVPFRFVDDMRDGAKALVANAQARGYEVILMSGDTTPAVSSFAARLGIHTWVAEALPQDKAAQVAQLAAAGKRVLMVGDGLNDTAALAGAHVSMSPATALDAARVASDVVLLGSSLAPITEVLSVARVATVRIRQNFRIATWYNVIAVPLAVAGLCSPLIAALAMSCSSITVSLNALRLK